MAVSYKKLFKMLIDKDIKKMDFCEQTGISYSMFRKLSHGENVQVGILETICLKMDCQLSDIAEVLPDPESSTKNGTGKNVDKTGRLTTWNGLPPITIL